jgi:chorismate dehydratase
MLGRIKIGAVTYLNTKPLVYRLGAFAPSDDLRFDLPSRLADDLKAARLDVALIPSIEFFHQPDYSIISDACIACRGPVLSVKLFSRVPAAEIRTLALDEGSRTSAALIRILLKERFDLEPQTEPLPIGASINSTEADAVVLIGDRAIHSPPGRFADVWDLGDQWRRWSGLPFVFAMWVARSGIDAIRLERPLADARDCGVANLERIAEAEAAPLGLTVPQCLAYLRDNLHFYLGDEERQGLDLFYRKAVEHGLAPVGRDLASAHS